ncbi:hypothetical protein BDN72DRAFT_850460 [Pluteus cervinus]|uniref:Uncharacterized protein n=1 Tax=Pluteus cervinus TaxID=181527 RepID=A0ACD3A3R6_9AGAR|nr:hypothetical protein BDN72DRAFT_850460 [Pluteus cervinus]
MGGTCPRIGQPGTLTRYYHLECARIPPRAAAAIAEGGLNEVDSSGAPRFDILRNNCGLSYDMLQHLDKVIDNPNNGFMLRQTLRTSFEEFRWALILGREQPQDPRTGLWLGA